MIGHIARLRPDSLRCTLLLLWLPLEFLHVVAHSLLPARWGGHPDKARLLTAEYWRLPALVFVAAMQGALRAPISHHLTTRLRRRHRVPAGHCAHDFKATSGWPFCLRARHRRSACLPWSLCRARI